MKKHLIIIAALVLYLIACGGGGDDNSFDKLAATTSLRIGRSSNSVGPIATSAALASGETVMIIYDATTGLISEVLFKNSNGEVIRVVVDPSGRPVFAETKDTRISFSNFTEENVDVLVETAGNPNGSFNYPLEEETINFLSSERILGIVLGVDQNDNEEQKSYLTAAVVALRIVGCAGASANNQFSTNQNFAAISNNLCGSPLLDEITRVGLNDELNLSEIAVTRIPEPSICNRIASFANARDCILGFGNKLVGSAIQGLVGVFPTPTPKPVSKPTATATQVPTTPPVIQPPTPPKSPFEGAWAGSTKQNFTGTFCFDGPLNFNITTNGDAACASPPCGLSGDIEDAGFTVSINGTLNDKNMVNFTWVNTNTPSVPINGTATGTLSGTSGAGTFSTDFGCSGTFAVTKQ